MLGRETNVTETIGTAEEVVPKRPPGLPVSPVTSAEANVDASVEESVQCVLMNLVVTNPPMMSWFRRQKN